MYVEAGTWNNKTLVVGVTRVSGHWLKVTVTGDVNHVVGDFVHVG